MKIYNERAISDYAHSTGPSGMAMESRRVEGYGLEMNQDAAEYEHRAKRTYSTALGIEADNTMNTLYAQYSDNPVELDKAFKKAYDKVIGEIPDKDVKVGFMADVSLKRQMYLTKAAENKRRNDYRIAKSLTYDGIGKNTETIGTAFSALLGDDFNPDVVAVYGKTMYDTDQMIHSLNDDGTYMFSDEQRKQKQNDIDKAHLIALKGNFNGLQPYQMKNYMELLSNDKINVPVSITKDNEIVMKNLQDIVSQDTYEKFKAYADNVQKKAERIANKYKSQGDVKSQEEIMSEAIMKEANRQGYKETWDNLSKKLDKTDIIYNVFDYRNSLQESFNNNGLDKKDYQNLMSKTVNPVIDLVEKQGTGKYRVWNDSFKVAAYRINELMNFEKQPQEVKAAAYELLYKNFGKYNLDPTSNTEDSDTINKCVSETVKQLAVSSDPSLLGVKSQRVLSGTDMINYDTTEPPKPAGELNYVIKEDPKTKARYKIYKNKDGSVDNNSVWVRIK